MRKRNLLTYVLSFALAAGGLLTSCDEVEESGTYDNWQARNEAYTDSIAALAGGRIVVTAEDADNMELGAYYAIQTSASTSVKTEYVYVRKLTSNPDGVRPYYTDNVSMFYYGTYINGTHFDGNFTGYSATDQGTLDGAENLPTEFDSPSDFSVNSTIVGWIYPLQYMREGERWMIYAPYASAYGTTGYSSIPAYSNLIYDAVMRKVYDR